MLPLLVGIYIEGEVKQVTYRLNCSGEFTRARFGHLEVFEKMTDEWPSLLAPGDKIVPIIAFGRNFLVELPSRSSWLSQETSDILPSDGVIFYMDRSRRVLGFSDTLDGNLMHLAHLLRSSKQRYMQFSPVLTTVGVRTCAT
jgi:hypothetical protein